MPLALPPADEAAALKAGAPEIYDLWIELARKNADNDAEIRRLPFEHSFKIGKRGQYFSAFTVLVIFAFCGYLASLGGAGPYIGGVLGTFNFVALLPNPWVPNQAGKRATPTPV
jgi:hypothetical protein